jgi:hypothetical protein
MMLLKLSLILCLPVAVGCGAITNNTSYSDQDMAFILSGIDHGSTASLSNADVLPYANALDALEASCVEDPNTVGDMTAATRKFLDKDGVSMSELQILRALRSSINATEVTVDCHGRLALWAAMTVQSQ